MLFRSNRVFEGKLVARFAVVIHGKSFRSNYPLETVTEKCDSLSANGSDKSTILVFRPADSGLSTDTTGHIAVEDQSTCFVALFVTANRTGVLEHDWLSLTAFLTSLDRRPGIGLGKVIMSALKRPVKHSIIIALLSYYC